MEVPNFYALIESYSLDQIYLLMEMRRGVSDFPQTPRIGALLQSLKRKGLCTESFRVTSAGEELVKFAFSEEMRDIPRVRREDGNSFYTQWLRAFPCTDGFSWRGRTFSKTRTLRKNTEKCRDLFFKILREGEYTAEELCGAIIAESLAKMEDSYRRGENKMSFITNSESYLRQRIFEGFMEDGRALSEAQIESYYTATTSKSRKTETNQQVDI